MDKNILLGITGGIAAYKMVEVASSLTKLGYSVNTVMTKGGREFVTPLTFQNITHNPVETELFTPPAHYQVKHISLAEKANVCLIGPATANFIGKLASGIADDLLSTIIMATNAPVLLSPSMNSNMYNNPVVQDNLKYLKDKGYKIIEPAEGDLACGYQGKGRLPEPEELVERVIAELTVSDLKEKQILITAGPTREKIDPIRYLSNLSSGKMGYSLARAACFRGANVTLISGPTNLKPPINVNVSYVESAEEMYKEVKKYNVNSDIFIMTAAVADFSPVEYQENKIKKNTVEQLSLKLKINPDILYEIGQNKRDDQLLVGFAAESKNLIKNARQKLLNKKLDMIIANDIRAFSNDENKVTIITSEQFEELPVMKKNKLADIILDRIIKMLK